jgi:uncharacterized ion transporter superfamily protein YfcC
VNSFFWGVMVLVIFIIGISDPPVWEWINDNWRALLVPALMVGLALSMLFALWQNMRAETLEAENALLRRRVKFLEKLGEQYHEEITRLSRRSNAVGAGDHSSDG